MAQATDAGHGALADPAIHEQWVSAYRTPETQGFYEVAFDEIVRRLGAPRGATFLDAGCGSCAKSVLLAVRGFKVVATDFSSDALALAAKTVRDRRLDDRIALRQGDLLDLPFRDGEFQYVLCWGVLMHVPQMPRAFAELARVLAPGGKLVVSEGNMYALQSLALRTLKAMLGRSRGRIVRTAAGIETHEDTAHGTLVTRQMNMAWFEEEGRRIGLNLIARMSGQFSELYVLARWPWLRRAIHRMNDIWFRWVGLPGPAFGNILIFEKRA